MNFNLIKVADCTAYCIAENYKFTMDTAKILRGTICKKCHVEALQL